MLLRKINQTKFSEAHRACKSVHCRKQNKNAHFSFRTTIGELQYRLTKTSSLLMHSIAKLLRKYSVLLTEIPCELGATTIKKTHSQETTHGNEGTNKIIQFTDDRIDHNNDNNEKRNVEFTCGKGKPHTSEHSPQFDSDWSHLRGVWRKVAHVVAHRTAHSLYILCVFPSSHQEFRFQSPFGGSLVHR